MNATSQHFSSRPIGQPPSTSARLGLVPTLQLAATALIVGTVTWGRPHPWGMPFADNLFFALGVGASLTTAALAWWVRPRGEDASPLPVTAWVLCWGYAAIAAVMAWAIMLTAADWLAGR